MFQRRVQMTDVRQLTFDNFLSEPIPLPKKFQPIQADNERCALLRKYADRMTMVPALNRSLVSFQANKTTPFYRWFKYREGFSHELVRYFLHHFRSSRRGSVLDPFAGAGTTLTTASKEGWQATGIELLPVGSAAIRARLTADRVNLKLLRQWGKRAENLSFDKVVSERQYYFHHVRITEQAFPPETENAIAVYRKFLRRIRNEDVRYLLWFACFAVLEDVSFTRKDGQYLRWDNRSGRDLKARFDKGQVHQFRSALLAKVNQMVHDIEANGTHDVSENTKVINGSTLSELPQLPANKFDLVITSPPYCNRYDYTRTYALELAFMDHGEKEIKELRQTLLSATVENKTKRHWLAGEYGSRNQIRWFERIDSAFGNQKALHEILSLLYAARDRGELNNNNIPNLVENYFYEMCFVIHELARVLAPNGHVVMVNDNVRYIGEEVPVDLILSDFAASAGLSVDAIWVLPRGKGNSSQQMGAHGRSELRKCVYIWSKG